MNLLLFGACLLLGILTPIKGCPFQINPPGCGIGGGQNLIVNGSTAKPGQFPWMVYVFPIGCGGSIITNRHVLTAAHCVISKGTMLPVSAVFYGDNMWTYGNHAKVNKVLPHPSFRDATLENDIAILQVEKPFRFSQQVRPICLPVRRMTVVDRDAIVAGWGSVKGLFNQTKPLRYTTTKMISPSVCQNSYKNFVPAIMLCARNPSSTDCTGDSGAPVFTKISNGRFTQVGIVSYGKDIGGKCSTLGSVYTRVDAYISWIKKSIVNIKAYKDVVPHQRAWHQAPLILPYTFSSNNEEWK